MDRRKTVLILDFDSELLIALEHLLENCGFNCTSTWDIDEGYGLMMSGVFDFLVIGNRPPRLRPQEIVEDLREAGLRFGVSILGSVDHQDGFSNLVDQLRSFPCELTTERKKGPGKEGSQEPANRVCHGS